MLTLLSGCVWLSRQETNQVAVSSKVTVMIKLELLFRKIKKLKILQIEVLAIYIGSLFMVYGPS